MKIEWASDEVTEHFNNALVEWSDADPEALLEDKMRELGWECAPIYIGSKPYDLLISVGDFIVLGAEYGARGVEIITLMFTDYDETLWMKEGSLDEGNI
jgi:hypothetical protein